MAADKRFKNASSSCLTTILSTTRSNSRKSKFCSLSIRSTLPSTYILANPCLAKSPITLLGSLSFETTIGASNKHLLPSDSSVIRLMISVVVCLFISSPLMGS